MWHAPGVRFPARLRPSWWRPTQRWVMLLGLLMIAAQLCFRGWAVYGAWFQFDDLAWWSIVTNATSPDFLMEGYGGHLMPAGFGITWLLRTHLDPLDFRPEATVLLVLQALASLGCLRLLRSLFGARPFILSCLALYLFSAISMPAYIWWAAGINQLPLQVAFFFGTHSMVEYLRTSRRRHALFAALWIVFGLLFYEKSLVVGLIYGVIAFGWFGTGTPTVRLRQLWRSYSFGIVTLGAVAAAYLAIYAQYGLNFAPGAADQTPLTPVLLKMVGQAWATGIVGGPLRWNTNGPVGSTADPSQLVVVIAWLFIGLVVYRGWTSRLRSLRAWSLPVVVLVADLLLVAAGRATLVGSGIGLEYRYQTELPALTAVALGLAFLPLRGAVETVEPKPDAPESDLERPWVATSLTLAVAGLGVYSSLQFVTDWQAEDRSKSYITSVAGQLTSSPEPVPLVDLGVPLDIMWAYRYPENTYSHVFRPWRTHAVYPDAALDRINVFDDTGIITPAVISTVRGPAQRAQPRECLANLDGGSGLLPLDGPVLGQGWWLRLGYFSRGAGVATLNMGDRTTQVTLQSGLHALYADAGSNAPYDRIGVSLVGSTGQVCITELNIGLPGAVDAR